jgi:hypothetical protein
LTDIDCLNSVGKKAHRLRRLEVIRTRASLERADTSTMPSAPGPSDTFGRSNPIAFDTERMDAMLHLAGSALTQGHPQLTRTIAAHVLACTSRAPRNTRLATHALQLLAQTR